MYKNENVNEEKKKKNVIVKILGFIQNLLYYIIFIPLLIATVSIVYQQIAQPEKIPDVFGYKMFIVVDKNMEKSMNYGDVAFSKNINSQDLKVGDMIAFKNGKGIVTIHKIKNIDKNEQTQNMIFFMETQENEPDDVKIATESRIEGIVKKRIPYLRTCIFIHTKSNGNFISTMYSFNYWTNSFIYCTSIR